MRAKCCGDIRNRGYDMSGSKVESAEGILAGRESASAGFQGMCLLACGGCTCDSWDLYGIVSFLRDVYFDDF